MSSSKENFKFQPLSHFKTPYSRVKSRSSDLILSKILSKSRTPGNNYGRSSASTDVFSHRDSKSDVFQDFDESDTLNCLNEVCRLAFSSNSAESVRNEIECEPAYFHSRKRQLNNKPNENSFENYLKLRTMTLEDRQGGLEHSKKSKFETGQEIQSKAFQIRARQNLLRLFTGSVENVLQWSKLKNSFHILFEVTAMIGVIQSGKWKSEKVFFLSDLNTGFRLQVFYYEIDRPLPKLTPNSLVTCVGRLLTRNCLQAYRVEDTSEEKKNDLQRLSFICNRVADELAVANQKK